MNIKDVIRKNRDVGTLDDPQFDKSSRYDWRRYVPDEIRSLWKTMSVESRVVAKVFAENCANIAQIRDG